MSSWRVKQKCAKCPFAKSGAGKHLWESLRPDRREGILNDLRNDGTFFCHETTQEDGDDTSYVGLDALVCAGSIDWQEENIGYMGQYARIAERVST